jgi:NAD(P)H-dependent FMN reductase
VFVTPEYDHATSGALKNAIDFLFAEWGNKAAGFVSYGGASGVRTVENLTEVCHALGLGDGGEVRADALIREPGHGAGN